MSSYMRKPAERRTERDNKLRAIKKTKMRIKQMARFVIDPEGQRKLLFARLEKLEMLAIELGQMPQTDIGMNLSQKAVETIQFSQDLRSKI